MSRNPARITTCNYRTLVAKTCVKCHILKGASEFRRRALGRGETKRRYDPYCRACTYAVIRESNRKTNDESLEKATRYREVWTKDEVDMMIRLEHLGLSTREIAERLGRSVSGVNNKLVDIRRAGSEEKGVHLCYYEPRTGEVRQVGITFILSRKGHGWRLNKAAQELSELHPQLIFFIQVDEGGEYMGVRGLDALKQGDDREPEDTSEDLEALATTGNS